MEGTVPDQSGILDRLRATSLPVVSERVERAYAAAREAYRDRLHWSDVPLLEHALEVLETMLPFEPDEDAVIATLLHHVLQVQGMTLSELEERFGPKVRALVGGCHLLSHVTLRDKRHSIDDLRLILLSVSDDVRTVLITLCERCATLRRIGNLPPESARRFAHDVLHLFAPVAARLGIYALKHELEARAFPIVYPSDAERLLEEMQKITAEKGDFLVQTATFVREYLREQGVDAVVEARQKEAYSLFQKMRGKSLSYAGDVTDLFAIRVIVNSEAECYQALGVLHRLGRPVVNRFKDYIAFPKPNGYQSLHTTLTQVPHVPEGMFLEVQVRTHDMHREAQYGIAAHWSYKEKGSLAAQAMAQEQLSRLLALQQTVDDSAGEGTLADHIFVLTPRGDIVELPEGATPLDFAFQVHTNLGLSFRAARVNGTIVPLDYALENGDVIEILKRKSPQPSTHWLQLLKTSSSRAKLKRYLYAQDRPALIDRGKELLNAELQKLHLPPLDTDLTILRFYEGKPLNKEEREDILMKFGQDSEKVGTALAHFDALQGKITRPTKVQKATTLTEVPTVAIEGGMPMPTRFAKCCAPQEWPRGEIAGVVNRMGSVIVHRDDCRMLRNASPERRVQAWWK